MDGNNLTVSSDTGFASVRYATWTSRFSTGRASSTQNETDNLFLYKSLVRSVEP